MNKLKSPITDIINFILHYCILFFLFFTTLYHDVNIPIIDEKKINIPPIEHVRTCVAFLLPQNNFLFCLKMEYLITIFSWSIAYKIELFRVSFTLPQERQTHVP